MGAFDDCRTRRLTIIRSSMAGTLVSLPTPALTPTLTAKADRTFGLQDARTMLATAFVRQTFSRVALTTRATMGRTRAVADGSDPNHFDGRIVSSAFSVEGARPMLGLSSSLGVERARASFVAPVAYDLVSGSFVEERRTFDLTPTARELDLELGWSTAITSASTLRFGVPRAFDAGHARGAADTAALLNLSIH